jgi:glutamate synthase (NADPH/NADH) large chain
MSGGIAYVYDVKSVFHDNCNKEMVDLDPLADADVQELKLLLEEHLSYTGSAVAKFILSDLENQQAHFIKVFPRDYKKVLLAKANSEKQKA